MRVLVIAVAALLAACSSSAQPITATSPSSSASPLIATPSPTAAPRGFGLSCRLPVAWSPTDAEANPANSSTGFVQAEDGSLSGSAPPPAPHFLTGGPSFDPSVGRWLPVPAAAISPDGLQYAYADYDPPASGMAGGVHGANVPVIGPAGRVHVVDARTGADRVLFSGQPTYYVLRFATEGIYLEKFSASAAGTIASGLYLMELTGRTQELLPAATGSLSNPGWSDLEGGAAWGTSFTTGIASERGPGNELDRFDLSTHSVAPWLTLPADHFVALLGVAAGNPLVLTMKSSYSTGEPIDASVLLLTSRNQSIVVTHTDDPNDPLPNWEPSGIADSHGLWLGGMGTVWLYAQGAGLRHITLPAGDSTFSVGGPCA